MTELTCDEFLGGRVRLWQPRDGYRAGVDPVLLAAACPAQPGDRVLELGCGAGAASLCLAARVADLTLTAVELQPFYADLARKNAEQNTTSLTVHTADLTTLPADLRQVQFDHVIMNPPYYDRAASTSARDQGRDIALGGDTPLDAWITTAAKRLAPRGWLTMIQRIDRLPESLTATANCLGSLSVLPITSREGRAPGLFLLKARKGGRAAFRLAPALVMHQGLEHGKDEINYTETVSAILRSAAPISTAF